jgi:hypothetical protein
MVSGGRVESRRACCIIKERYLIGWRRKSQGRTFSDSFLVSGIALEIWRLKYGIIFIVTAEKRLLIFDQDF